MRLDALCSTNKYWYTQMDRCIYLECILLRSHETKKGSQMGQKGTEELLQWDSSQHLSWRVRPQEEAQRTQNSLSRESWKESALMGVGSLQDLLKLLSRRSANARIKPKHDINRLQSHLCCCQQNKTASRFPPELHITDSPVLVLPLPYSKQGSVC